MSTLQEREAYLHNPYFKGHAFSNFSSFYSTIAVCTVLGGFIILLNIICCCSKYRHYWQDRHTGNRWLVSIWTATPHKQPPLDLKELKPVNELYPVQRTVEIPIEYVEQPSTYEQPILQVDPSSPSVVEQPTTQQQRPHRPVFQGGRPQRPRRGEEYVELQKRESDI